MWQSWVCGSKIPQGFKRSRPSWPALRCGQWNRLTQFYDVYKFSSIMEVSPILLQTLLILCKQVFFGCSGLAYQIITLLTEQIKKYLARVPEPFLGQVGDSKGSWLIPPLVPQQWVSKCHRYFRLQMQKAFSFFGNKDVPLSKFSSSTLRFLIWRLTLSYFVMQELVQS